MANNLTDYAEAELLDWLHGSVAATRPTAPMMLRLMTVNGTDSSPGTEVVGGSYTPQVVTLTSAVSTPTNTTDIEFADMPAVTVVGVEIWDSAGSPVRLWYGALTVSKVVGAGDTLVILAGELDLALS